MTTEIEKKEIKDNEKDKKLQTESNDVATDLISSLAPDISETFDAIVSDYSDTPETTKEELKILQKAIQKLGKWIIQSYKDHKKEYIEFDG